MNIKVAAFSVSEKSINTYGGRRYMKNRSEVKSGFKSSSGKTLKIYTNVIQRVATVQPAKSDSDLMVCLQSYQGLIIDRSLVY